MMPLTYPTLRTQLPIWRAERGLTQAGLAAMVGRAASTIDNIEAGKSQKPRLRLVRDLAGALGVAPAAVLLLAGYGDDDVVGLMQNVAHDAVWRTMMQRWPDLEGRVRWISALSGAYLAHCRQAKNLSVEDAAGSVRWPGWSLLSGSDWVLIEQGRVPPPLAGLVPAGVAADLERLPGGALWALGVAVGADPDVLGILGSRFPRRVAQEAGIDWSAVETAWRAAQTAAPPYVDVDRFLAMWRAEKRVRPIDGHDGPAQLSRQADGSWQISLPASATQAQAIAAYTAVLAALDPAAKQ